MAAENRRKVIVIALIAGFSVLGLSLAALTYLLNQPKWVASTALAVLKRQATGIVFKEMTIESLRWRDFNRLELTNVRLKFKVNGDSYFVSAGQADADDLRRSLLTGRIIADVKSMALVSDRLNCSDIAFQTRVHLNGFRYERMETAFVIAKAEWDQYVLKDVKGGFDEKDGRLDLMHVQARGYAGELQLAGWIKPGLPLTYQIDTRIKSLHSALLAEANPSFAQLTAVIDGVLNVADDGRGLMLKADLSSVGGGSMKASLLQYLVQYVPQRRQVEELIAKDADVNLSRAEARVTSIGPEKLSSEIILNSSSLNLNMNVKFDINMDGGIGRLLEQLQG